MVIRILSPFAYHIEHLYVLRPNVPPNLQNSILAQLISLLDGVSDYRTARREYRKAKKKSSPPSGTTTEVVMDMDDTTTGGGSTHDTNSEANTSVQGPPSPAILRHLVIGINQVTKRLESCAQSFRHTVNASDDTQMIDPPTTIKAVFVCRADVDPPGLIAHLPQLVAACNAVPQDFRPSQFQIKLVPLHKDAESALAAALGQRRVAVLAIDVIGLHFF